MKNQTPMTETNEQLEILSHYKDHPNKIDKTFFLMNNYFINVSKL